MKKPTQLPIYQVDAFTHEVFGGNPAAVCPLEEWLPDKVLQQIAEENNLSETVFYTQEENYYRIRWFTPLVEVDLCGHATLAAAFVLFNYGGFEGQTLPFFSPRSGDLSVAREGEVLTLNFPSDTIAPIELSDEIKAGFDISPIAAFKGKTDFLLVFEKEADIQSLSPSLDNIRRLPGRGVIATAKGEQVDFVSRFFAPQSGVDEDPVTGSAHTTLTPYWANELGKSEMTAVQLSARKGYLTCKHMGDRVEISGQARLYLTGEIHIPAS